MLIKYTYLDFLSHSRGHKVTVKKVARGSCLWNHFLYGRFPSSCVRNNINSCGGREQYPS
jgi:hypothetical protein